MSHLKCIKNLVAVKSVRCTSQGIVFTCLMRGSSFTLVLNQRIPFTVRKTANTCRIITCMRASWPAYREDTYTVIKLAWTMEFRSTGYLLLLYTFLFSLSFPCVFLLLRLILYSFFFRSLTFLNDFL